MTSTTETISAATQVCVCVRRVCAPLPVEAPSREWAELFYSHLTASAQQRTSDGIIDRRVFQGIIDLNDVDSTDFSTQMVHTYLAVATSTLADMDRAVCVTHFISLSLSSDDNMALPEFKEPIPSILSMPVAFRLPPPFIPLFVRKVSYVLCSKQGKQRHFQIISAGCLDAGHI